MTKRKPLDQFKYKKLPYNRLTKQHKEDIVKAFYDFKDKSFDDIADELNVSRRALSRVLIENDIKTTRKNRYTLNDDYFSSITTEQQAYFLGLLYADGYVGNDKTNNIVLSFTEKDAYILEDFAKAIDYTGPIRVSKNSGGFRSSSSKKVISFSSLKMAADLRKIGLYPNKSTTLVELPDLEDELYRHFIRGYYDGDGGITSCTNTSYHVIEGQKKTYRYPSYKLDIIGTKEFLEKIKSKIPIQYGKLVQSKSEKMVYLTCTSKKDLPIIFDFLYKDATIFFTRKYEKMLKILGDISR